MYIFNVVLLFPRCVYLTLQSIFMCSSVIFVKLQSAQSEGRGWKRPKLFDHDLFVASWKRWQILHVPHMQRKCENRASPREMDFVERTWPPSTPYINKVDKYAKKGYDMEWGSSEGFFQDIPPPDSFQWWTFFVHWRALLPWTPKAGTQNIETRILFEGGVE